jgi:hypothetical protein
MFFKKKKPKISYAYGEADCDCYYIEDYRKYTFAEVHSNGKIYAMKSWNEAEGAWKNVAKLDKSDTLYSEIMRTHKALQKA